MLVRDAMTMEVHTVDATENLHKAAETMRQHGIRHVPIIEHGRVVGVISTRDVEGFASFCSWLEISEERYHEYLERPLPAVLRTRFREGLMSTRPDEPLVAAARRMAEHRLTALPVVDDDGRPVGMLSYVDVLVRVADAIDDKHDKGASAA